MPAAVTAGVDRARQRPAQGPPAVPDRRTRLTAGQTGHCHAMVLTMDDMACMAVRRRAALCAAPGPRLGSPRLTAEPGTASTDTRSVDAAVEPAARLGQRACSEIDSPPSPGQLARPGCPVSSTGLQALCWQGAPDSEPRPGARESSPLMAAGVRPPAGAPVHEQGWPQAHPAGALLGLRQRAVPAGPRASAV